LQCKQNTDLQQLPYFDPWHVVFPPQEPSDETVKVGTGEAEGFTEADDDGTEEERIEEDNVDALHVPKAILQPLPQ
jgi:hypothetical protein